MYRFVEAFKSFERKKNWRCTSLVLKGPKFQISKLDECWLRDWVPLTERLGPLGLKRLHKEQGITWHRSWHPTCLYFEEKKLARMGCRNWNLGPRMAQKWSKMIQMPKKCIKSSYLANYYTNFIHFEMPGQIWTKMIEMAKICRNGCSAHIYTGCHKKRHQ